MSNIVASKLCYSWICFVLIMNSFHLRLVKSELSLSTDRQNDIQFEHSASVNNLQHECRLRPVVHVLQHDGCIPKPIPSFACVGTCSSYVQVSNSKFWQVERSCNCCQEIGEREATISLFCPGQTPKFRQITTRAPVDCICRPCSGIDEQIVKPQEIADILGE